MDKPEDRTIMVSRSFKAPRQAVFDALTKPEIVKQWMLGPPGWSMTVCEIDLKLGGKYRYVWRQDSDGTLMGMGGVFRQVKSPEHFVVEEIFDKPWYAGHALVTTALAKKDDQTVLLTTIQYESKEVRDSVLKTPMLNGLASSYDNLTKFLAA
jgi:uncharacterized protein YndB with AHSA1/START domain